MLGLYHDVGVQIVTISLFLVYSRVRDAYIWMAHRYTMFMGNYGFYGDMYGYVAQMHTQHYICDEWNLPRYLLFFYMYVCGVEVSKS